MFFSADARERRLLGTTLGLVLRSQKSRWWLPPIDPASALPPSRFLRLPLSVSLSSPVPFHLHPASLRSFLSSYHTHHHTQLYICSHSLTPPCESYLPTASFCPPAVSPDSQPSKRSFLTIWAPPCRVGIVISPPQCRFSPLPSCLIRVGSGSLERTP